MAFYEEISKYYDYIFPTEQPQIEFIIKIAGRENGRVLDVACGSGGYTQALCKEGFLLEAVDIDEGMVREARIKFKKNAIDVKVEQGNMTELTKVFEPGFECIFCIGNSIVHLGGLVEIEKALREMYALLNKDGRLIIQIINYDRVLKYGVNELPPMINHEIPLEFVRKYRTIQEKGVIAFDTVLKVGDKENSPKFENSIELLPVTVEEFKRLLKNVGFEKMITYGNFEGKLWSIDDYLSIFVAEK